MPFTRYADRLDTIIYREYGSLDENAVRTLLWANPALGADFTPPVGTEYVAAALDTSIAFSAARADVEAIRERLDD